MLKFLYFCYGFKIKIFDEPVVNLVLILANFLLYLSKNQFGARAPALRFGVLCGFYFRCYIFLKLVFLLLIMLMFFLSVLDQF